MTEIVQNGCLAMFLKRRKQKPICSLEDAREEVRENLRLQELERERTPEELRAKELKEIIEQAKESPKESLPKQIVAQEKLILDLKLKIQQEKTPVKTAILRLKRKQEQEHLRELRRLIKPKTKHT